MCHCLVHVDCLLIKPQMAPSFCHQRDVFAEHILFKCVRILFPLEICKSEFLSVIHLMDWIDLRMSVNTPLPRLPLRKYSSENFGFPTEKEIKLIFYPLLDHILLVGILL